MNLLRLVCDFVQVFDKSRDLWRLELENRHVRMPGNNPFGEGFLQAFQWPFRREGAQRWRSTKRALIVPVHRMASGAMFLGQLLSFSRKIIFIRMPLHNRKAKNDY